MVSSQTEIRKKWENGGMEREKIGPRARWNLVEGIPRRIEEKTDNLAKDGLMDRYESTTIPRLCIGEYPRVFSPPDSVFPFYLIPPEP
jgi:hypothetical protein